MNRLGLEEEKIIEDKIIKKLRNSFKSRKENETIKDRIIREI